MPIVLLPAPEDVSHCHISDVVCFFPFELLLDIFHDSFGMLLALVRLNAIWGLLREGLSTSTFLAKLLC